MEGKKCFPFTSAERRSERNGWRGSGRPMVEVETTDESNSAFSTFCSTLAFSLGLFPPENVARRLFQCPSVSSSGYKVASAPETCTFLGESTSRVSASIVRDVLDLTSFHRKQSTTVLDCETTKMDWVRGCSYRFLSYRKYNFLDFYVLLIRASIS